MQFGILWVDFATVLFRFSQIAQIFKIQFTVFFSHTYIYTDNKMHG